MAATEATPRVALLARAGEACERISGALREAGAEVVLVADPLQADPEDVRHATPQAILVALDPAIEDAIDRYADVLADPDYMVIFEEADQAAQRTGWDAARWLRHLSAKLHRHHDVLPAGAEADDALHPTPGPLQAPRPAVDFEQAIVEFTDQAQQHADEVPRDGGLEGMTGLADAAGDMGAAPEAELPIDDGGDSPAWTLAHASVERVPPVAPEAAVDDGDLDLTTLAFGLDDGVASRFGLVDDGTSLPEESSLESMSFTLSDDAVAGIEAGDAGPLDELAFDPERFMRAGEDAETPDGIEEFLAAQMRQSEAGASDDAAESGDVAPRPADGTSTRERDAPAARIDFSGLSLLDDGADPAPAPAGDHAKRAPAFDIDALGGRLSLADPDSYGHGPVRGVVLIEAGLGGPDAVRQLLAALPEGFTKPILIRLPLEGGRYDRLVKQMTRATSAPVSVAEAGQVAQPGSIYFVPPGLGLRAGSGWKFDASASLDPDALPADDSAVLFLSGADAALVPAVTDGRWNGGLVLGQTPDEGCYEPAAARAAIASGADHGTPAALAARLLARWPVPGASPDPDPSGMLQP
ncbi:chemotaxis protein CheB [Luteimonas kalidii]|uniref:Chemotaxis protein CheB n=1 Tax=Luteimonas kalidii TaxID=3042025 RepID=A0ABT6JR17_9GAMM|nr:chemotaxis protein CheB [Luteimonas kalidii]MDH5833107.1 chemotaxis protein CheB [Luteimonas kalidii]